MTQTIPRIMLAGTGSGCGKTTVTCALLKAISQRGAKVVAFKAGPDYIDPMFHTQVLNTPCRNLDITLCGEKTVKYLLAKGAKNADLAIIEGVMGIYDGRGFDSDFGSANHLARTTSTPEILVVQPKGMGYSVAAMISGYLNFCPNQIKGVILNNTTPSTYAMLKPMLEETLPIRVYGYLPPMPEAGIESRHLGLVTAQEITDLQKKIDVLGEMAEKTLDISGILALAQSYENYICTDMLSTIHIHPTPAKIAVARDRAFCFYYEDNLDLLREFGCELVAFSPLEDKKLPDGIQGLLLGGGYPELYAEQLSENSSMREDILKKCKQGLPTVAECGGFMYLSQSIADSQGKKHPMVGLLSGDCSMTQKLVRFGYTTITAKQDNLLCQEGESIAAHEFHYSDCTENGQDFVSCKRSGKTWDCIHGTPTLYAGYPHLHLWGNLNFAENFCKAASAYPAK